MWLAASSFAVPDGVLATLATAQLSGKPHQGVPAKTLASPPGIGECNSTAAIGLRASLALNGLRQSERARYYGSALGRWTSPDLVNVTEQRLVNPSSTLNKYVYAANSPFKYVDPDGQDITYFYDQGGFAGHAVLFAYNQGNGDSAIESFGPASKSFVTRLREVDLEQVPGKSMFDMEIPQSAQDLRDTYATLTIQTTPELTQQVIDYMRANPDPKTWGVLGPNCSSKVLKILQKFKLDHKGWAPLQGLTPKFLWSNLYSQYVGQRVPVPQNGSKYGNLRNGYDPFDLLFLSLKQHCHTTTATWTENGKSTGTTSVTTCN